MKKTIAILSILFASSSVFAEQKYNLRIEIAGIQPSTAVTPDEPEKPSPPSVYDCKVKYGISIMNGVCSNNVLTFKFGLSTITGTCENGNYTYTSGLGTNQGTCQ